MAAAPPTSLSSLLSSSSNYLSPNATASSSASASASASASYTTSTDCQKGHPGAATTTTATQKQNQKRRQRHLYAQKLNNSAASCIEIGQYDRAISSLSKALQLSEQEQQEEEEEGNAQGEDDEMMTTICSCYHCTVDGCIEYSEKNPHVMTKDDPFVCVAVAGETNTNADTNADTDADSSYIYRRPIQVTPRSIQGGHNMGSSLCLLISFNLALAYHLKAITITTTATNYKNHNKKSSRQHPKKQYMTVALKLYTHVIQWQTRLIRQNFFDDEGNSMMSSTAASFHNMRLKMVLLNNMSHIHRCDIITTCTSTSTDNKGRKHKYHEKSYIMCLELLLSSIMLVVEYKTRISSLSSATSLPYIMIMDLERFLQNTSPLLMGGRRKKKNGGGVQDHCASAA